MSKHCILIVDNDPEILEALKLAFRDLDCELLTATNGQEALHLIVELLPSLIISEWHMPVLDGLGLFLQVKNSPQTSHIPFIFLTTINDIDVRLALLESGAEDYWGKPYDVREAKLRVRRLLERLGPPEKARQASADLQSAAQKRETGLHDLLNGRYEVIEEIGKGGMGVVYRAKDLARDRQVALKVLRRKYVADEVAVRRFAREAEAAMRIVHPNVVSTYEYGLIPTGQAYIAMELLSGHSLEEELIEQNRLSVERVLTVMRLVCLAVGEAHRRGVIHRDLKPSNVFLVDTVSEEPLVKVLDFGIALLQNLPNGSMRLTNGDTTVGTPLYLSPEQATGKPMDARSDIYSLGIVFYELLTGCTPFIGNNYQEVLTSHLREPPTPIQEKVQVDDWLAQLVMKMLAKRPAKRPQSVEEIVKILEQRAS